MATPAELPFIPRPEMPGMANPFRARFVDSFTSRINAEQESKEPGKLLNSDVQKIIPDFFVQNPQALLMTICAIRQKATSVKEIEGLTATVLQQGWKAQILRFDVTVDQKPYSFITYLSRGADGETRPDATGLADEARQDAKNLRYLAEEFEEKLNIDGKNKFGVVEPITEGNVEYEGKTYPFFTMPLLPLGELRVFETRDEKKLFFGYSLSYNRSMELRDRLQLHNTENPGFVRRLFQREQGGWKIQRNEVLTLLSLMYLTTGRLPKEFLINAGDIVTRFSGDNLFPLELITVRGGFTDELSSEEFVGTIQNHVEPRAGMFHMPKGTKESLSWRKVFSDVSEEEILSLLKTTQKRWMKKPKKA